MARPCSWTALWILATAFQACVAYDRGTYQSYLPDGASATSCRAMLLPGERDRQPRDSPRPSTQGWTGSRRRRGGHARSSARCAPRRAGGCVVGRARRSYAGRAGRCARRSVPDRNDRMQRRLHEHIERHRELWSPAGSACASGQSLLCGGVRLHDRHDAHAEPHA